DNLEIIGRAVGEQPGAVHLQAARTPEFNKTAEKGAEKVQQTTLDAWWEFEGRSNIDLIKIDVNGDEAKVMAGAETLLSEASPVILFAISDEQQAFTAAVEQLHTLDYTLYEYVPGPQLLTEFNTSGGRDPYLGNLIAIKEDRAAAFKKAGLIHDDAFKAAKAK